MRFLGSKDSIEEANIVLLGIPFDATSSFRGGSRFAPDSIRIFSDVLESYSPYLDKNIEDIKFYDYGNCYETVNNYKVLDESIEELFKDFLLSDKKVISIGGEHLISLPVIKSYNEFYNDLVVVHIDAHADLRDEYFGEKYSHATVMRRVSEILPCENIYQFGIRSGIKDEFIFAKNNFNFYPFLLTFDENIFTELKNKNIYLTIDLDVLEPSCFPGTGTPEPGGVIFNDLLEFLVKFSELNVVGADVVELSPDYDKSGVSSIVAAKVIRELIIILNKNF